MSVCADPVHVCIYVSVCVLKRRSVSRVCVYACVFVCAFDSVCENSLLASQEGSGLRLEGNGDNGEFKVPLLLQLGQHPCPEEHLALTDTVQVRI